MHGEAPFLASAAAAVATAFAGNAGWQSGKIFTIILQLTQRWEVLSP